MGPETYISGQPVSTLAKVSELVIASEFPDSGIGGPASAEFTVKLGPAERPAWLTTGQSADVRLGGSFLLAGQLSEPDWAQGKVTITGAAREGETTACLTAGGLTSSTPDTVIDAAIARGALTWSRPASISTASLADSDQTSQLNTVVSLLAAYADENDTRLYVDAYRRLLKASDPTTPAFYLMPGSGELAWTTQEQATRVVGGWHTAAGAPQVTSVGSGAIEQLVNLDPLGALNSTRATNILTNLLARAVSGGWTNGVSVSAEQIFGHPHLADVLETIGRGCMFRLLGQRDPRPGRTPVGYVDFICERGEWNVADGTITLTPRGMVADDWNTILTEFGVEAA